MDKSLVKKFTIKTFQLYYLAYAYAFRKLKEKGVFLWNLKLKAMLKKLKTFTISIVLPKILKNCCRNQEGYRNSFVLKITFLDLLFVFYVRLLFAESAKQTMYIMRKCIVEKCCILI